MKNKNFISVLSVLVVCFILNIEDNRIWARKSNTTIRRSSNKTVDFFCLPQFSYIKKNSKVEFNLVARLAGKNIVTKERAPLDLVVVIDRSGSMTGDKIRNVKVAAVELLKKLRSVDRVTLISYASSVTVHHTRRKANSRGKRALRNAIFSIEAGGSTALGPAMYKALDLLSDSDRNDQTIAHVVLMSDGLANVGVSSPTILGARAAWGFSRGISLSTMGVGLDYNEDLMTKIADQGGGRYHFIKNSDNIVNVLNDEFNGIIATIANSAVIEFIPSDGVEVVEVFGYSFKKFYNKIRISIGSLSAKQKRDLVIKLFVKSTRNNKMNIGKFILSYSDMNNDGKIEKIPLSLNVNQTYSDKIISRSENTEVTVRVTEVESAERLDEAAREVQKGKYDKAKRMIRESIIKLRRQYRRTPSLKLRKQIKDMEKAYKGIDKAKRSLSERKRYIKFNKSRSYLKKK